MLIPYATDRPRQRTTVVVYALIALNVAVFLVDAVLPGPDGVQGSGQLRTSGWLWGDAFQWWALFSYQFLHAGPLHLLGNMLFLFALGPNVEDRLGRFGFLGFYLAGGAGAGFAHMLFSPMPVVGASGSIAAVTGAFLVLFPNCRIRVFSLFIVFGSFELPAWWFIGFQIAWNLVMPAISSGSGVSYAAHLGGYAFGAGLAFGLLASGLLKHETYDLFTTMRQAARRQQIRAAVDEAAKRQSRAMRADAAPALPEAVMHDRAAVNAALSTNPAPEGPDAVVGAYAALGKHPDLPRSARSFPPATQLELANRLFAANAYELAARAYDDLLDRSGVGQDAQTARVLLARLCAHFLGQPDRARALLEDALQRGLAPELAEAARDELGDLPSPSGTPSDTPSEPAVR